MNIHEQTVYRNLNEHTCSCKKRVVSIPFGNCLLLLNFAHAIVMYTVPVQYMTVTCHVVPFILYM